MAMPGDRWTLRLADGDWTVKILFQRFDEYGQWSYQAEYPHGTAVRVYESELKELVEVGQ